MRSDAVLTGVVVVGLLWSAVPQPVPAAKEEPRLSVVYEPPRVSVEARGVTPAEVLRAIGARVGFAVIETRPPAPPITLSIKGATLEAVLRQLLRPENYVLVYREQAGGDEAARLDTIIVLGPPAVTRADPDREVISSSARTPVGPPTLPPAVQHPDSLSVDRGGTESVAPDGQRIPDSRRRVAESPRSAGGTATAPSPSVIEGAPDPASVREQILERVRTLVDAVRRATLDGHR